MKAQKINIDTVKTNLKLNIKLMVLIISSCVLMGFIIGIIDYKKTEIYISNNNTQIHEKIDLDNIEKNEAYYYNAFMLVKEKNAYFSAYMQGLDRIPLSIESKDIVVQLEHKYASYKSVFLNAEDFFYNNAPYPVNLKSEAIDLYENKIKEFNRYKESKENILKEKKGDEVTIRDVIKIEEKINIMNEHINVINERSQEDAKKIMDKADVVLDTSIKTVNDMIDNLNSGVLKISENDNYEIVYYNEIFEDKKQIELLDEFKMEDILNDRKNQAFIYAKSLEGIDPTKERFSAIVGFFILFGIVISLITGAFYQKKKVENA